MINLDKIIEKIIADATLQAQGILEQADAEISSIESDSENYSKDALRRAKIDSTREKESIIARGEGAADMKGREILLSTRVALISKVFDRALEQIISAPREDYLFFLSHLLCDAALDRLYTVRRLSDEYLEEDQSADFLVIFNENDRASFAKDTVRAARALLKKQDPSLSKTPFEISESSADIKGGFILRYGDIETNCSVEAVIAEARRKCESRVIALLFKDDDAQ